MSVSNYDKVFSIIGSFGYHQKLIVFVGGIFYASAGLSTTAANFMFYYPEFSCDVENNSQMIEKSLNFLPVSQQNRTNCTQKVHSCYLEHTEKTPCTKYKYQDSTITSNSIITEFNLICKNKWFDFKYATVLKQTWFLGQMLGALAMSFSTDNFGRRKTMIAGQILCLISGVSMGFVSNINLVIIFRVLVSLGIEMSQKTSFIYVVENVGTKKRSLATALLMGTYRVFLVIKNKFIFWFM